MIKDAPWLMVIAGPNGAGKSTFYNIVLSEDPILKEVDFVNLDNYAKELSGPEGNPNDHMLTAGRLVYDAIDDNIASRTSFIYETTASGMTHLKIMDKAKDAGYNIATIFIGLADVELSHLRVQQRIEEGGHSVPSEDIERRFPRIFKIFPEMLARSDSAAVFDNSFKNPYKLIFFMENDRIKVYNKYPDWLNRSFEGRLTSKTFEQAPLSELKELKKAQLAIAHEIFSQKRRL